MERGKFIIFEGIDGCGKSTQIQFLKELLEDMGEKVYVTAEPTNSLSGAIARSVIEKRTTMEINALASSMIADRIDHLMNPRGIKKMLDDGIYVICDRWMLSTWVYNRTDENNDFLYAAFDLCVTLVKPDYTIYLDVNPEEALNRISSRLGEKDLFEEKEKLLDIWKKYQAAQVSLPYRFFGEYYGIPQMSVEKVRGSIRKIFCGDEIQKPDTGVLEKLIKKFSKGPIF